MLLGRLGGGLGGLQKSWSRGPGAVLTLLPQALAGQWWWMRGQVLGSEQRPSPPPGASCWQLLMLWREYFPPTRRLVQGEAGIPDTWVPWAGGGRSRGARIPASPSSPFPFATSPR